MTPHAPTVARLDSMPTAERSRLLAIARQYSPETLAQVEETMRKHGVPEEHQLDVGMELLDKTTPGGFGEDVLEDPQDAAVPAAAPVPVATPADAPPADGTAPELSTGGTIADVIGKLMAGIAVGVGERGGNSAKAAADQVRQMQQDQLARRKAEGDAADKIRTRAHEEKKFAHDDTKWAREDKKSAKLEAADDPSSEESQILHEALFAAGRKIHKREPTPEEVATVKSYSATQAKAALEQQSEEVKWAVNKELEEHKRAREITGDQFKREQLSATQAGAAASREATAAQREGTMQIRQGQLDERRASREGAEAARAAQYEAKYGVPMPGHERGDATAPLESGTATRMPVGQAELAPTESALPLEARVAARQAEAVAAAKVRGTDSGSREIGVRKWDDSGKYAADELEILFNKQLEKPQYEQPGPASKIPGVGLARDIINPDIELIQQKASVMLASIPYPPGSQSDKEMQARIAQLVSPATRPENALVILSDIEADFERSRHGPASQSVDTRPPLSSFER